ncbi:MAG: asparagine synthetase B, partial [Bdellovibrionaceae bacterium]|nr:asparagine synthetase B [Pseudobdellovibrionaceae bacterium]
MCGLAGIFSSTSTTFDSEQLTQMSTLMLHRGPDAAGVFSDSHIALVHRRLKIIDLSDQANQPMHSENHVLVFNGEIYNYPALRAELEKSGCIFKTRSDTEVLLLGLEKFEESFIPRLEGDFSFCFYNKKTGTTLIARDRFGVKPLYLSRHAGKIFFSSEIKPLFAAGVPRAINHSVIREYFQYRYVGGLDTLFEGITHFPPGHYLKIKDSTESLTCYYNLLSSRSDTMSFEKSFESSVAGRLLSDRTLNLLLSGGIDSSAIAAQISLLGHKTSTLTYSFNARNGELDEYPAAKNLALSLQFVPRQIKEVPNDFLHYPEVVKSLEEPIGDSIILANSHL